MELREKAPGPHCATFDLDGSLIWNDSAEATLHFMAETGYPALAPWYFSQYYQFIDAKDLRGAYRFGATTLAGFSAEEVKDIVRKTLAHEGEAIGYKQLFGRTVAKGIVLRKHVARLFQRLHAAGIATYIVSASPQPIVEAVVEHYDLLPKEEIASSVIGVRNVVKDGILTDQLVEPLSIFDGKPLCIRKYIASSVRPLLAVGDSMNDLPMLEYVQEDGVKAVVDRGNQLAEIAKQRGWAILEP